MNCENTNIIATLGTLAVVFATIIGPVLAVRTQRKLDLGRAQQDRQTAIFRTLMTERLALSAENVRALNAVPIEFFHQESIISAFRAYVDHLGIPATTPTPESWMSARTDLFFDLLQKIANQLGYKYNFVQLKKDFYWPSSHVALAEDEQTIRRGLADLLAGKIKLPLDVQGFPADPELNKLLKDWLKSQLH